MTDLGRRTARTLVLLSLISMFSKVLGFIREQVIAHNFGVSVAVDTYVAADLLPTVVHAVVGASLTAILIPLFTSAREKGEPELRDVVFTGMVGLGAVYAVEALFLWLAAPLLVSLIVPGLEWSSIGQAVSLARITTPAVALLGLSGLATAYFHSNDRFFLPGVAPLAANGVVLVAAFVYRNRLTVEHIALTMLIGYGIQSVLLLGGVLRGLHLQDGTRFRWAVLRQAFALAFPLMLASVMAQALPVADKFLASHMDSGSIAALNYATKLVQLPVTILGLGISTVMFPRFSHLAVKRDREAMAFEVGRSLQGLCFVMMPVSIIMIALANPIVSVAFERGQFDARAVAATSGALVYYAFGILPMTAIPLVTNALLSLRQTKSQLAMGIATLATYLVVAVLLAPYMEHRALAVAASLGYTGALAVGIWYLSRSLGKSPLGSVVRALPRSSVATFLALLGALAGRELAPNSLTQLVFGCGLAVVAYLAGHLVMRSEEAGWLVEGARKVERRLVRVINSFHFPPS